MVNDTKYPCHAQDLMLSHMSPLLASPSADDQWPACKVCDVPRTLWLHNMQGRLPSLAQQVRAGKLVLIVQADELRHA